MLNIRLKRVYDPPDPSDGLRLLVDRMWPRGFTRERLQADDWLKHLAPSPALIKQFHSKKLNWEDFLRLYHAELELQKPAVKNLVAYAQREPVTLLYASRNLTRNQAIALLEYLEQTVTSEPNEATQ